MRRQLVRRRSSPSSSFTVLVGLVYPLGDHRHRPGRVPRQGQRLARRSATAASSARADRPELRRRRRYFHPRPSAAGDGYDATASSASNLGPTNPALLDGRRRAGRRLPARERSRRRHAGAGRRGDASGSGLDPHISPANARLQAPGCRGPRPAARRRARARRASTPTAGRSASSASRRQRARAEPRARRGATRSLFSHGARHAAHLPRRRAGRRQDLRDARRGSPAARARRPTSSSAIVETHGRPKTAAQIGDLEVVPRRRIEYRGTTFEEMDLDAILARQPEVVLVDELAHTNVPGSRHEKRWQDVEELLDAGIDVISTVNIQHLESLNDVVEQITGIKQRETVPDAVVRGADQIELVDMAPEALRRRHGARQHLPGRAGRRRARQLLPRRATSARCASSRCCGSPTGSTRRSLDYRDRHGITGRGRRASGSSWR